MLANLSADEGKLLRVIKNYDNIMELQKDLYKIWDWNQRWKLEFNAKNIIYVMELGVSNRRSIWEYKMEEEV